VKYLEFQFSDGTYRIPAYIIARDRAHTLATLDIEQGDAELPYSELYQAEYTRSMNSDSELIEWAQNSMDWKSLEGFAFRVHEQPAVPHEQQWNTVTAAGKLKIANVETKDDYTGLADGQWS